ncbi:dihydrodipicolinate reductase [Frankia sp. CNm7]|uniref:Dihydrodipicolinate reductase n=1 Tax=Frankia nepalensis TaxID=1836974 RepID=A0A937RJP3_9ACTN|nr:dihydrodipicolinate reductase [Frankia nepalensis]MBL7498263.1 dihydrodipicolinate reductase [Frankia nepalensis]MBL7509145.1 dihydrodipicolinate reductase [Frankia nepalensis]MBL7519160.1 dihydrodipicolinate reductase [Frankia nepalensis]MBL7630190.1 dihydrodipicolinate reductase [Frankia nepalensis]
MAIRVVQWTTGGVAKAAVRGVLKHPALELVGCFAWSPEKAGRDVGELLGTDPIGIIATADIDDIIALKPDVVLYMPLLWDVDAMVRLLESGINVISTANFITGHSYGDGEMKRIDEAARRGGVSVYGTGISPGLIGAITLTAASGCRELERISIFEAADCSSYESEETWSALGFGKTPDTPGIGEFARLRQLVFMDAVEMLAKAVGVELDDVRYTRELGLATEDIDLGWMQIPKGTVCGINGTWSGIVDGHPLVEIGLLWRLGNAMEPNWPIDEGHRVEIVGVPGIRMRVEYLNSDDPIDYHAHTANPAVNAIPAVVAAPPGLVTVDELPLITAGSVRARTAG